MDFEYTVTESIHRNRYGEIIRLDYEFEETTVTETAASSTSLARQKERRNRTYDATVNREQYEALARRLKSPLSFEAFVTVLRPFILGFYSSDELERAFAVLDRDHSGGIHVSELNSFLPILNDTISDDALLNYIRKVDSNFDGNLNYEEFRDLVLRGIGRDIICNHI